MSAEETPTAEEWTDHTRVGDWERLIHALVSLMNNVIDTFDTRVRENAELIKSETHSLSWLQWHTLDFMQRQYNLSCACLNPSDSGNIEWDKPLTIMECSSDVLESRDENDYSQDSLYHMICMLHRFSGYRLLWLLGAANDDPVENNVASILHSAFLTARTQVFLSFQRDEEVENYFATEPWVCLTRMGTQWRGTYLGSVSNVSKEISLRLTHSAIVPRDMHRVSDILDQFYSRLKLLGHENIDSIQCSLRDTFIVSTRNHFIPSVNDFQTLQWGHPNPLEYVRIVCHWSNVQHHEILRIETDPKSEGWHPQDAQRWFVTCKWLNKDKLKENLLCLSTIKLLLNVMNADQNQDEMRQDQNETQSEGSNAESELESLSDSEFIIEQDHPSNPMSEANMDTSNHEPWLTKALAFIFSSEPMKSENISQPFVKLPRNQWSQYESPLHRLGRVWLARVADLQRRDYMNKQSAVPGLRHPVAVLLSDWRRLCIVMSHQARQLWHRGKLDAFEVAEQRPDCAFEQIWWQIKMTANDAAQLRQQWPTRFQLRDFVASISQLHQPSTTVIESKEQPRLLVRLFDRFISSSDGKNSSNANHLTSEEEDVDEFFDTDEPPEAGTAMGRLQLAGFKLFSTDKDAFIPQTLIPSAPLTDREVHHRMGQQVKYSLDQTGPLASDMAAFKAANPGCALQDFVQWHSPRDVDPHTRKMSARMTDDHSLWQTLWRTTSACPAAKQPLLYDPWRVSSRAFRRIAHVHCWDVMLQVLPRLLFDLVQSMPIVDERLMHSLKSISFDHWNDEETRMASLQEFLQTLESVELEFACLHALQSDHFPMDFSFPASQGLPNFLSQNHVARDIWSHLIENEFNGWPRRSLRRVICRFEHERLCVEQGDQFREFFQWSL